MKKAWVIEGRIPGWFVCDGGERITDDITAADIFETRGQARQAMCNKEIVHRVQIHVELI